MMEVELMEMTRKRRMKKREEVGGKILQRLVLSSLSPLAESLSGTAAEAPDTVPSE